MGIIQPPFSDDEDRFDVTFIKQPPRYELLLTIKGTCCDTCSALTQALPYMTYCHCNVCLGTRYFDEYLLFNSDYSALEIH